MLVYNEKQIGKLIEYNRKKILQHCREMGKVSVQQGPDGNIACEIELTLSAAACSVTWSPHSPDLENMRFQ
jgi:hypothetical protein